MKEEKIWIIQHYTQSPHLTQLRRDFIHHFNITNKKKVPNTTAIKRIIKKFEEEGTVLDLRAQNKQPSTIAPYKKIRVKEYFDTKPKTSLRSASRDFNLSYRSIQLILDQPPEKVFGSNKIEHALILQKPVLTFCNRRFRGEL